MIPDPNLARLQRQVNAVAALSWVALGVAVMFLVGYLVFTALYHTPVISRVPIALGFALVTVAATLQVVFAQQARRSFPHLDGMVRKVSFGVIGVGAGGFALALLLNLIVMVAFGSGRAASGSNLLFGCCVFVFVPVASYLLIAALKVREVNQKYGPEGASQLLAYQLYQEQRTHQVPPIHG
ncbi:hypothetical protein [Leucobacter komagatae]|uniref:Uncharacterized protein n=1 Tax=Leucobacter komagatae TaxID=55969 RepID=A0A0D0HWC3_9MICO|nr:hypothetical protein [Leucobacter komagatae]KIP51911.1 hypothetical protein SD72_12315 [Leucobacter komagatae]